MKMPRSIRIDKMQAAGNDFVVVDDMRLAISSPARRVALARQLCHRQYGVGADGLILIQPPANGACAYRMRIINSDGSEAEMCGNGSRCAVKFAVENRIAPRAHAFETLAGVISGRYISSGVVRVSLTTPSGFRPGVTVRTRAGGALRGSFINTGVPHFVSFVPNLAAFNVRDVGAEIRLHKIFAPRGTNVNFVRIRGRSRIDVRTYERGVESETLACGTGSTASAIVAALTRRLRPPISVRTSGGSDLLVDFTVAGPARVTDVTMQGPVEKVFETKVML